VIVPPGVLVPVEACGLVGDLLRRYLQRTYDTDAGLARLVVELARIAEAAEVGSRPETELADERMVTVSEFAEAVGLSERAVRHRCQVGALDARKAGASWLIAAPSQPRPQRSSPSRPTSPLAEVR
jgi:hypothetical protein